jgi:hypothetical protein
LSHALETPDEIGIAENFQNRGALKRQALNEDRLAANLAEEPEQFLPIFRLLEGKAGGDGGGQSVVRPVPIAEMAHGFAEACVDPF